MAATKTAKPKTPVKSPAAQAAEDARYGVCSGCRRTRLLDDTGQALRSHRRYVEVAGGTLDGLPGLMIDCPGSGLPPLDLAAAFIPAGEDG